MKVPITGQSDLFVSGAMPGKGTPLYNTHHSDRPYIGELLAEPKWNAQQGRWEALANIQGMLCIIEVSLHMEQPNVA